MFNRRVLPAFLASFSDLVGIVVISDSRDVRWRRLRYEWRRSRWRLLDVSDTDYLPRNDWRGVLGRIRQEAPRAQLFYRLNISHAVRQAEAEDIRKLQQAEDERAIAA